MFTIINMKVRPFEIISSDGEILAYGCIFGSGKCIMEWTGDNKLLMIWETFEEMDVVSKLMKATIVFIEA